MNPTTQTTEALVNREYKYGFVTDIENDTVPRRLSEATVRLISAKKNEPNFMLDRCLKACRHWMKLKKSEAEPKWANNRDRDGGRMTYKEHRIFIEVSIEGRPQVRFVHAAEAENSAFQIARERVDHRLRNS